MKDEVDPGARRVIAAIGRGAKQHYRKDDDKKTTIFESNVVSGERLQDRNTDFFEKCQLTARLELRREFLFFTITTRPPPLDFLGF